MNIVVFPGQGAQKLNMAKDLYDNYSLVKKLFKISEEISELPLRKIIFNGYDDKLKLTSVSQVAIMLASVSTLKVLEEVKEKKLADFASILAGHSLGEYTALVASGALTFENAVELLKVRGKAMEQACPTGGAMLAVIGIESFDTVKDIAKKASLQGGVCEVANDNAKGQVILSGSKKTLDIAAEIAKTEYKAKLTKFLEVSGPFHSSLMGEAVNSLKEALNTVQFDPLKIPFISNITASKVLSTEYIKSLLLKQIVGTVRWRESILYAVSLGVDSLIEVGPGKILTGLAKRIDNNIKCVNIENINDIKDFSL